MRDAISQQRAMQLHPLLRDEVIATINAIEAGLPDNAKVRIVQGLRTFDEQAALFAQGRTKPGNIVTNAKAGQSYHNYGLAIDFALMYDKDQNGSYEALSWDTQYDFDKDGISDWQEVVKAFKAKGWSWGGDWHSLKDNPHLEKAFGYKVGELLSMHNSGQVKDGYVIVQFV